MVMPSSSVVGAVKPHIGSDGGGGTRFGAIPESQWPALPAQHGIVSDAAAVEIGRSGTTNDKATKTHRLILKHQRRLLCCFVTIELTVWACQVKAS